MAMGQKNIATDISLKLPFKHGLVKGSHLPFPSVAACQQGAVKEEKRTGGDSQDWNPCFKKERD